jgi:RNA binding exosome subunit
MSSAVQSLEVSYFIQMTEDEEKVRRAVAAMVGGEIAEERQEAYGHHGNKIVLVRLHLTGDGAEAALSQIISHIDPEERRAILGDLEAVTDEHNALYIRLSKQVLVMRGSAVLASSDPVRVKVKPRSYIVKRDPEGFYARLFGGAADF